MKSIETGNEKISSVWFFLKTIYLSPVLNPAFPIFLAAAAFLLISGDILPPDVLFMMFTITLSTSKAGELFRNERRETAPFLHLNPLPLKTILKRIFCASFVFSLFSQSIFLLVLFKALSLPRLGDAHIVLDRLDSGEIISELTGFVTDLSGRAEIPTRIVLRPSLIFGVVKTIRGWEVPFPFWMGIAAFFMTSSVYFSMSGIMSAISREGIASRLIRIIIISGFVAAGCLFFIDMIFPSEIIWNLRNTHREAIRWILPPSVALFIGFSLFALIRIYRNINRM